MKFVSSMRAGLAGTAALLTLAAAPAMADFSGSATFGDIDLFGIGYSSDPLAGATLIGLAPGMTSFSTHIELSHAFPFSPEADDLAGTDQIYAGAFSYAGGDGYSGSAERINGVQIITIDYSSLILPGEELVSLTLGIAADDFQNTVFSNPFTAIVNGQQNAVLNNVLNTFDQTGPDTQFFTIGIALANLNPDHTLTLQIRQDQGQTATGGTLGDGWAIDFLTIGVETVPTPGSVSLIALAGLVSLRRRR